MRRFPVSLLSVFALGALVLCGCRVQVASVKEANLDFAKGAFASAGEAYDNAIANAKRPSPEEIRLRYNLGSAYYKQDEATKATGQLQQAAERVAGHGAREDSATRPTDHSHEETRGEVDTSFQFAAYYNLGAAYYREREYSRSAEALQAALVVNPDDVDAKHNLELALEELRSQMSVGGAPDEDTPQPTPRQGDGDPEPMPQNPTNLSPEEAERLVDMFGGDDAGHQQQRIRSMLPPRYDVEKDW
jgi:tetratricopeptide (TPR) repeat protein